MHKTCKTSRRQEMHNKCKQCENMQITPHINKCKQNLRQIPKYKNNPNMQKPNPRKSKHVTKQNATNTKMEKTT